MFRRKQNATPLLCALALATAATGSAAQAQGERLIDRADYADRLRAMWLGQCLGQRAGVRSEGRVIVPPFLTDADWNTIPPGFPAFAYLDYATHTSAWTGDDDTEIEYVYLHLMTEHQTGLLSASQIAEGWITHIPGGIYVSNLAARNLMLRGVRPPGTALGQGIASDTPTASDSSRMIDAQLTTEVFGLLSPGMPEQALAMADLPIRTTSTGFATHAAQFYVLMFSLVSQVDAGMSARDQAVWLVQRAREYIPATSKSADVVDFVLGDFLANPDRDNWELTRDRVYLRYQANGPENPGFDYQTWFESPINLAQGLICWLYGEMEIKRVIRIGTLCGWDSDNGTATMAALAGFRLGYAGLLAEFPTWSPSDRYLPSNQTTLPDRVPTDPSTFDTFTLMAARMLPVIDANVTTGGGQASASGGVGGQGQWLLPPFASGASSSPLIGSPTYQEHSRSANRQVRAAGGAVTAAASHTGVPPAGSGDPVFMANGFETDWSGSEPALSQHRFFSSANAGGVAGSAQTIEVLYDRPVWLHTIRFIEGDHFSTGGWANLILPQKRLGGAWTFRSTSYSQGLNSASPFQVVDMTLAAPVLADGIRLVVIPGTGGYVTCLELDAFAPPLAIQPPSFDHNGDGRIDAEDLYSWLAAPADLNGDSAADSADLTYLMRAVRWEEDELMTAGRR